MVHTRAEEALELGTGSWDDALAGDCRMWHRQWSGHDFADHDDTTHADSDHCPHADAPTKARRSADLEHERMAGITRSL